MTSTLLGLLMSASAAVSGLDDGPAVELRYSGTLTPVSRDGNGVPAKRFGVYCLVINRQAGVRDVAFVVDERGGGVWPWPERYGLTSFDAGGKPANRSRIKLLLEHDGTLRGKTVPQPVFAFADRLKPGATWKADGRTYEVRRQRKVKDFDCWQIDVSTNFGRVGTLMVDRNSPLVVSAQENFFRGQGEQYQLKMELDSVKPVDQERLDRLQKPLETLLVLKQQLNRKENEQRPELDKSQLATASAVIARLEKQAESTPFSRLAAAISRDVKSQRQRVDDLGSLAAKFVGKKVLPLELTSLSGKPIDSKQFKDKIVVLHFWNYKRTPLIEPYGQIGYLDFLNEKNIRRKFNVKVYGVAVSSSLGNKDRAASVVRSFRQLKEFFNLSYEVTIDRGTLLRKFGDPRRFGAKLPLWVVIAPDGTVAHYHAGFYNIKPDEGLRQLAAVIAELVKKQRAADGAN